MINKIILGTVQLGLDYGINNQSGKPSLDEAFKILDLAYESGIRLLDTAEAYGNSQEVIGKYHEENSPKRFNVITKFSTFDSKKSDLEVRINENMKLLQVDSLFGYMFHNYEILIKNKDLYEVLVKLKNEGKIKNIGISLYENSEVEDIINHFPHFDFIQIPFNLLDNTSKRGEILRKAKENNLVVHTRSVFLQGLFFKDESNLLSTLNPLKEPLTKIKKIAKQNNLTIDELALKYALEKEYIDNVLIGVDTAEQLFQNIETLNKETIIPYKEIDLISVPNNNLLNPSKW